MAILVSGAIAQRHPGKKEIIKTGKNTYGVLATPKPLFEPVRFGVKAGLNVAGLTNLDAHMKPSFYTGLQAEFQVSRTLRIQPEVVYSRQGATTKEGGIRLYMRTNYINIPVMLRYFPISKWSFEVGPQIGFMFSPQVKGKVDDASAKTDMESTFQEAGVDFKSHTVDFAIAFGISYRPTDWLDLTARCNAGINPSLQIGTDDIRNICLQFGAAYRF